MKGFSKVIAAALFCAVAAFAQDEVSSSSSEESSSSEYDFFARNPLDEAPSDTALADSALADSLAADSLASSSSRGEGLVLYDGQKDMSSDSQPRRKYSRDNPIYRYQVTAGLHSPSRGIVSLEYIVFQEELNVGVHFTDYTDELLQIGASVQYYPMAMRYFYFFLTADWMHGEYERERRNSRGNYEDYDESVNYWRTVVGIGGEVLFMAHMGLYIEAGFEFYAGEGGYYLHMNKNSGYLDSDDFKIPYGAGLLFPF
ncbi:MAG: hypothetical protein MJY78_01640 [Fibrobacter sp.]|nr:hypothetical protein [Fibrobacter sp.]